MGKLTNWEKERIRKISIKLCAICFARAIPNFGKVFCEKKESECHHILEMLEDEQSEIKKAVVGSCRFSDDEILKSRGIE